MEDTNTPLFLKHIMAPWYYPSSIDIPKIAPRKKQDPQDKVRTQDHQKKRVETLRFCFDPVHDTKFQTYN